MQHHPGQLTGDGTVEIFDDWKVGREEYVKVTLLDL